MFSHLSIADYASISCDFEDSRICGYKIVGPAKKSSVYVWSRGYGQTSSANTGPPADHTYGNSSSTQGKTTSNCI